MNIKQQVPLFQVGQYPIFPSKPLTNPFQMSGSNGNQMRLNQPMRLNGNGNGNVNIPLASKFVTNINPVSQMSMQEKVVAFGQDRDENFFKRSLRKKSDSSAIKATYYNIVKSNSNNNHTQYTRGNKSKDLNSSHLQQFSTISHLANMIKQRDNEPMISKLIKHNTNPHIAPNTTLNKNPGLNSHNDGLESISKNQKEYFNTNCSAVSEYAYYEDSNFYYRQYMEDKGQSIDSFNNTPSNALFCLYDGHGGDQVSQYLQYALSSELKQMLNESLRDPNVLFNDLFASIDNQIKQFNYPNIGSTACVVYLTKENNTKVLYCANIGDTRCVLISKEGVKRLSYDHRASEKEECERIIRAGGIVFNGRVYGQLMLSRCFGDFELKPYGVISTPYISRTVIGKEDEYIVIGTDGVWDVLNDDDVLRLIKEDGVSNNNNNTNANEFVHLIAKTALLKGSMDNISCFVIKI